MSEEALAVTAVLCLTAFAVAVVLSDGNTAPPLRTRDDAPGRAVRVSPPATAGRPAEVYHVVAPTAKDACNAPGLPSLYELHEPDGESPRDLTVVFVTARSLFPWRDETLWEVEVVYGRI